MNITETIVRKAAPYKAVALDVFDTLIHRDVAKPTDLFLLQGETFAQARIQAEREARAATQGEVTLAQIYARPCLAGWDPAQECGLELSVVVPNYPMLEAVRQLHAQGKRLYYISDMYLPQEQISAMLRRCGYDMLDGGFVSSTYGVQKRSGKLFHRFLHETGLKASDVLFVGDDWRADVFGAALAGIRAWHVPKRASLCSSSESEEWIGVAVQAFVRNRLGRITDPAEALGYSIIGPLEVAFCQWIRAGHQDKPLFFLARDMFLTREIYQTLYPEQPTSYLQVSRRSLCPALLQKKAYTLLIEALPRQILTGEQIAEYCGVQCPKHAIQETFNLKDTKADQNLIALLKEFEFPQDSLAEGYLQQSHLQAGNCLVDIGSGGTTQMLLESLLNMPLQGLQLSGDERLQTRPIANRTDVFLSLDSQQATLYWSAQPMLERMISEDVGATVGYRQGRTLIEVCRQPQATEPILQKIQDGAKAFAYDWQKSVLRNRRIPQAAAIEPFLRLVANPTWQEVDLLGPLTVEDGGVYPLASPKTLSNYLYHPQDLKRDLAQARWKIGFMKKLLPGPLPYGRLYQVMKKK